MIHTAHLKDAVLCDDDERNSPYNTIRVCSHIHAALDRRLLKICPDTGLVTSDYYTPKQMTQIGIPPGTVLEPLAMVPERRAFLRARINDYEEFEHAKAVHMARKAEQEVENGCGVA